MRSTLPILLLSAAMVPGSNPLGAITSNGVELVLDVF